MTDPLGVGDQAAGGEASADSVAAGLRRRTGSQDYREALAAWFHKQRGDRFYCYHERECFMANGKVEDYRACDKDATSLIAAMAALPQSQRAAIACEVLGMELLPKPDRWRQAYVFSDDGEADSDQPDATKETT